MMKSVFGADDGDGDGDSPQNEVPVEFEVDEDVGRKLEYNRERVDLERYEKLVKEGLIKDDGAGNDSESEMSEPGEPIVELLDTLRKFKRREYSIKEGGDKSEEDGKKKKKRRKKKKKTEEKMYLKDVQARQLLEDGPDFVEEGEERRIQTHDEQQEALRKSVSDAMAAEDNESDDADDLLREKEGDELEDEDDEEVKKKADEYFGEEAELDEGNKFLRDYLLKQMWKEKDGKSNLVTIDEAEKKWLLDEEEDLIDQEHYECDFRHEEGAGEILMGQSRVVEGSVRKKESSRNVQRKSKKERMDIAKNEREEELKRLKNVKKKEIEEKMKRVLAIAGFKEGEECAIDGRDLDGEFDPVEYDKMMKAVYNENYYGAEDDGLCSDEDGDVDGEKPEFDKEDELLGLPKDWDVIQSGDGFVAAREKALKLKENVAGSDEEGEVEEEEQVEEVEEGKEGKRKRKRKASLVKRAKEALMDEYYKLDYEDTIGDLKTRFKFAKVQPNSYGLKTADILVLDDTELNQYVPLKKMAPFVEKDWEVNKYKVKEQKLKINEAFQKIGENNDKRSKKRSKKSSDVVEKTKPAPVVAEEVAEEEVEGETSKLSRRAKRRRREAASKLSANRMVAYGKTN